MTSVRFFKTLDAFLALALMLSLCSLSIFADEPEVTTAEGEATTAAPDETTAAPADETTAASDDDHDHGHDHGFRRQLHDDLYIGDPTGPRKKGHVQDGQ